MQEGDQHSVSQDGHDLNESTPLDQVTESGNGAEEKQTSTNPTEGDSNEVQREDHADAQRELERLRMENEKQKQTIAALTGTEGVTIDTNDLAVLYHLQLRETQRLQNEIDRLHQMLSDVLIVGSADL